MKVNRTSRSLSITIIELKEASVWYNILLFSYIGIILRTILLCILTESDMNLNKWGWLQRLWEKWINYNYGLCPELVRLYSIRVIIWLFIHNSIVETMKFYTTKLQQSCKVRMIQCNHSLIWMLRTALSITLHVHTLLVQSTFEASSVWLQVQTSSRSDETVLIVLQSWLSLSRLVIQW